MSRVGPLHAVWGNPLKSVACDEFRPKGEDLCFNPLGSQAKPRRTSPAVGTRPRKPDVAVAVMAADEAA